MPTACWRRRPGPRLTNNQRGCEAKHGEAAGQQVVQLQQWRRGRGRCGFQLKRARKQACHCTHACLYYNVPGCSSARSKQGGAGRLPTLNLKPSFDSRAACS